ncbi:MFS multidrug transporter-like protein [Cryomyces antarcticus]|uniref:Major facilitator superfamily (MFS) profile domain-containing protein n=1 Tax=Cryomyces antarcticus TaxID=329879 RepID=A0ABR0KT39_9PEZI|nr:hypothetical protein LTR16_002604 [Cryomyces antarcticus]
MSAATLPKPAMHARARSQDVVEAARALTRYPAAIQEELRKPRSMSNDSQASSVSDEKQRKSSSASSASTAPFLELDPTSEKWVLRPTSWQSSTATLVAISEAASKAEKALPPPAVGFSKVHEVAIVINVCMAQFLSLAALAQSVAPLLIIGESFNVTNPGQLSWYTAAFSLTVGTFIMPAGRLGDMYGHKKLLLVGWAWFAAWSLITGFSYASGSTMFTVARAFQGIGPSLLVPNAMALVGSTFPMGMKRNIVFSCFGAAGPTGFVVGAVFSSLLAQLAWWPWAFWALAIACVGTLLLSCLIIPADSRSSPLDPSSQPPTFDFLGCVTGVSGLVLVNFAWNQAPIVGWSTPYVYALLVVGVLSFIAFIYVQLRVARFPLIPLRGLHKEAGFALACIAAGWGSHGIWIYYLFLFLERARGYTPLAACAQTSTVAVTGLIAALSTGLLLKKMRVAYVMFLAMLAFVIGTLLVATAPVVQTYWLQIFFSVLVMPVGMNLSFPAGTILLSNALPREHQGVAASLVSTMVNYSISIGLGVAGTIERQITQNRAGYVQGYRSA